MGFAGGPSPRPARGARSTTSTARRVFRRDARLAGGRDRAADRDGTTRTSPPSSSTSWAATTRPGCARCWAATWTRCAWRRCSSSRCPARPASTTATSWAWRATTIPTAGGAYPRRPPDRRAGRACARSCATWHARATAAGRCVTARCGSWRPPGPTRSRCSGRHGEEAFVVVANAGEDDVALELGARRGVSATPALGAHRRLGRVAGAVGVAGSRRTRCACGCPRGAGSSSRAAVRLTRCVPGRDGRRPAGAVHGRGAYTRDPWLTRPCDCPIRASAHRLDAAIDREAKIPRALEALGPIAGRRVVLLDARRRAAGAAARGAGWRGDGRRAAVRADTRARPRARMWSSRCWSAIRPGEEPAAGQVAQVMRILDPTGRLLVVHDYGRDDVTSLLGSPERESQLVGWSHRHGPFLANGFKVRVLHCWWSWDTLDDAVGAAAGRVRGGRVGRWARRCGDRG